MRNLILKYAKTSFQNVEETVSEIHISLSVVKDGTTTTVGKMVVSEFRSLGHYSAIGKFRQLDIQNTVTQRFYPYLFNTNGKVRPEVKSSVSGHSGLKNLCFLDKIEIYPEFRGQGVGKRAMALLIRMFSNKHNYLALRAEPFLLGNDESFVALSTQGQKEQVEVDKTRLQSWFRGFGFSRPANSSYMLLAMGSASTFAGSKVPVIGEPTATAVASIPFSVDVNNDILEYMYILP